jgi:hypothetical protein
MRYERFDKAFRTSLAKRAGENSGPARNGFRRAGIRECVPREETRIAEATNTAQ